MIERRYRPFTNEETKELEAALALRVGLMGSMSAGDFVWVPICFGILLMGGGAFIGWIVGPFLLAERSAIAIGIAVGFLLTVGLTCVAMITERRAAVRGRSHLQQDFDDGRMEEVELTVSRAAKLDEYEDEGPGYFLQIEAGVLLFLQSQQLLDLKPFPAERVTIARCAGSRQRHWEIVASEKKLLPARRLSRIPHQHRLRATEAMVFRGSIDTLEQDLARLTDSEPDLLEELLQGDGRQSRS